MPTPEIKQASSASVQILRLRRGDEFEALETFESESNAVSESEIALLEARRNLKPLELGV